VDVTWHLTLFNVKVQNRNLFLAFFYCGLNSIFFILRSTEKKNCDQTETKNPSTHMASPNFKQLIDKCTAENLQGEDWDSIVAIGDVLCQRPDEV